jgi:hypothetical protein
MQLGQGWCFGSLKRYLHVFLSSNAMSDDTLDNDALSAAAVKIQAIGRGMIVRKVERSQLAESSLTTKEMARADRQTQLASRHQIESGNLAIKPLLNRPSSALSSLSTSNAGPMSMDLLACVWPEFKSTPRPPPTVANLVQHCRAKREPDRGLLTQLEHEVSLAMQVVGATKQVVLETGFEASAAGKPVDTTKPGATNGSMELIFMYYAARQSVASTGLNSDPTFEDIEHANTTISAGEFIKFMDDMVMYVIPRNDVFNVFQPRKAEKTLNQPGPKDDADINQGASQELDFSDFLAAVVRLSIYIFRTSDKVSYHSCVEQMAQMLHAEDSHYVKEYLTLAGRVNAGFGAWKMAPEEAVAFKKPRKPRIRQSTPMSSLIPGSAVVTELCQYLLGFSGKVYNVTWDPFSGPYIAMVIPTTALAKRCRLQIVLRNMSPTHFMVDRELFGVPCLQIKSMPPKKIAAGMDYSMELWVDSSGAPCEHLGGVQIFEGEDRKFLFTIPIYIKIVATSNTTVEDEITLELGTKHKEKEVIIQNMCRSEDKQCTGELPKELFLQILSNCGLILPKIKLNFLVWRVRSSDTTINYEDFFNIFYSSAKQKEGPNGGMLAQLFGPENAIRLCKGYCCAYTPKVVEAHLLARALSRSSKGLQLSESAWTSGGSAGNTYFSEICDWYFNIPSDPCISSATLPLEDEEGMETTMQSRASTAISAKSKAWASETSFARPHSSLSRLSQSSQLRTLIPAPSAGKNPMHILSRSRTPF